MSGQLRRTIAASLICALLGALFLVLGARWITPPAIAGAVGDAGWTGRSRAWFTPRGFFGAERDTSSGREFSWTAARARLIFANLDRSQSYHLSLDVAAFRPGGASSPILSILVDGDMRATMQTSTEPQRVSVELPARSLSGAIVILDSSQTFVPGPGDNRSLGVMLDQVRLEPASGHFTPSWRVCVLAALAIGASVLGVLLCGLPGLMAVATAGAFVVGFVWLLLLDAAFIGDDVERLVRIGTAVAVAGALLGWVRSRWPSVAGLPEWATAAGLVLGTSALKLAFFTHPQIALTDAFFQVHRAELVHRGEYFFTSVTPSPSFEFPYAIALYVAAQPFWSWFPTELDLANLLRGLALCADALVGVVLYAAARRQWNSRTMALLCAAVWPLTRAPAMALGHANLTNLFGQGLFGVAAGLVAWMAAGAMPSAPVLAAAGVVLTLAFLSHFSTLSIGLLLLSAMVAGLMAFGRSSLRQVAVWVLVAMIGACAVSYTVYYSHFTALYRQTFTRVVSGVDKASSTSMVASPALKFQRWITEDQFSNDYGLPGLALLLSAVLGAVWLVRARPREGLTLLWLTWALVWAGSCALGIFTSVELRANLAATPMFVSLAAYGLGTMAARSRLGAAAASVGFAAIAWDGLRVWLFWLGH